MPGVRSISPCAVMTPKPVQPTTRAPPVPSATAATTSGHLSRCPGVVNRKTREAASSFASAMASSIASRAAAAESGLAERPLPARVMGSPRA